VRQLIQLLFQGTQGFKWRHGFLGFSGCCRRRGYELAVTSGSSNGGEG
jgi:hypothetical protein